MLIACLGTEHHDLYQLNINNPKNVFLGLEQGESPYWQGTGNTGVNPALWTDHLLTSDPDFSWCTASDVQVRTNLL
jgi:glucan 1,3-beta-glucosidase